MAKFKVMLERIETITHQGEVMVEASTAEEARRIIVSDLFVDEGSYDEHLEPIEDVQWMFQKISSMSRLGHWNGLVTID